MRVAKNWRANHELVFNFCRSRVPDGEYNVSRNLKKNETPIETVADLVEYFEDGCKPITGRGIGTESENFGLSVDTLEPIPYDGERGIGRVFELMVDRFGWRPEVDEGRVVAAVRDSAAITIEPGGQLELSGSVQETIHGTAAELSRYHEGLAEISRELGLLWLGAGSHPLHDVDDIPWMPKSRYDLMVPFLGERGSLAHNMMKATCTVQANLDYTSERDCGEIVHLSARVSPIVTAIFANSAVVAGQDSGYSTYRSHVWTKTDPARCGTPSFMLESPMTFAQYTDYLLDIPVMFIRRNGAFVSVDGISFRELLANGHGGHHATMGDWELHVSTAFPDIRVKQFVEGRGADSGGRATVLGVPALWKGLLYDAQARAEADALIGPLSATDHAELYAAVCREGLKARAAGLDVLVTAQSLLRIAREGLERQAEGGDSEAIFLDPFEARLAAGLNPADEMRQIWRASGENRRSMAEHLSLLPVPTFGLPRCCGVTGCHEERRCA